MREGVAGCGRWVRGVAGRGCGGGVGGLRVLCDRGGVSDKSRVDTVAVVVGLEEASGWLWVWRWVVRAVGV